MKPLDSVILFSIEQTSKTAKRYSQKAFDEKGLGITVDQWVLLKIIEENENASQKELAVFSFRDGASITRTLNLLEDKGFIQRSPLLEDKRQYCISLSAIGKQFILNNMIMVNEHRSQSTKGFTEQELLTLKSMLKRIQENME